MRDLDAPEREDGFLEIARLRRSEFKAQVGDGVEVEDDTLGRSGGTREGRRKGAGQGEEQKGEMVHGDQELSRPEAASRRMCAR